MYQVMIKGRNLNELKKAVEDIHNELQGGKLSGNVQRNMDEEVTQDVEKVMQAIEEVEKVMQAIEEVAPVVEQAVQAPVVQIPQVNVAPLEVGEELDSKGHSWDSRIHTSKKTKKVNGEWKLKRGVDPVLVDQVLAEQKGASIQPAQPAQPAPAATPVVEQPVQAAPVVEQAVQAAPVVEQAVQVPPMNIASGHTPETFVQNFPMVLTGLISSGKINQEYVESLKAHYGVAEIWNITDDQKVELFNLFAEHSIIQRV